MKIALHGYGKMGRAVEQAAQANGHEIAARFDRDRPVTAEALQTADVVIDFSNAELLDQIVDAACQAEKDLVIGTTGWNNRLPALRNRCKDRIGVVYAANFSPGANVFFRIAREAAAMFAHVPDYAAGVEERHHAQKKDAPSGTAVRLAREVKEGSGGKLVPPVASLRVGHEIGLHRLVFDSPDEVVELSHRARSRMGFARGAILAAEKIRGRKGFFSFEDLLFG